MFILYTNNPQRREEFARCRPASTETPVDFFTLTACPSLCREGLVWVDINWMDNGECLDLIEKVCYGDDVIRHEDQSKEMG